MSDLGYHIIYFDVDTDDYDNDTPQLIVNAQNNFSAKVEAQGTSPNTNDFLVIAHDIHQNTASTLVPYMLEKIKSKGYRGMPPSLLALSIIERFPMGYGLIFFRFLAVTVGDCMGDPVANWYRS